MNKHPFLSAVPLAIGYPLGILSGGFTALWVGAFAKHFAADIFWVGIVASLELTSVALTSLASAAFLDMSNRRWPFVAAVVVSIIANLLSSQAPSLIFLGLFRILAGCAHGFLLADIGRRAAAGVNPPRVFSSQMFALAGVQIIFFSNANFLQTTLGPGASFVFCAAVGLILLIACIWLPRSSGTRPAMSTKHVRLNQPSMLVLLAAVLIFSVGSGSWAFLLPAGEVVGVPAAGLAMLLTISSFINLLAPIASDRLAPRVATLPLIGFGLAGFGLAVLAIGGRISNGLFSTGVLTMDFFMIFLVPLLLSRLVAFDPSSRAVAASAAFFMTGTAVGPGLWGFIFTRGGPMAFTGLAALAVLVAFVCIALAQLSTRRPARMALSDAR
jgi:predicted MFS family arabinose efflux permease